MSTTFIRVWLCSFLSLMAVSGVFAQDDPAPPPQVFVPLAPADGSSSNLMQTAQLGFQVPVGLLNQSSADAELVDELEQRTKRMQLQMAALSHRLQRAESPAIVANVGDAKDSTDCDAIDPGWQLDLDTMAWKLARRNSDFAITTDNTSLAVGRGNVQTLDVGWEQGLRGRLAYRTASGWLLGVGYTSFHAEDTAAAAAPVGGNLWATRSHPDFFEQASTANASSEFDLNIFDLEAMYSTVLTDSFGVELFGGLRWADINQDFSVQYDGTDFTNGEVTRRSDMTAFGVRMGGASHWILHDRLSVFARAAGSVLYGRFDQRLRETNLAGVDTIVDVTDEFGRPVTVIETAVGVALQYREWLQIRGGYELANWAGLDDRAYFNDNAHEGAYSSPADDVLMHGGYVRFSIIR